MVTGRGAVDAAAFATALAGFTPAVLTFDTTKLTATHPTNMKRVKKGAVVTFEGVLTNVTGAHPIANRQIIVIGNGGIIGVDRTGTSGKWEIRFKVKKRTSWHAVFMGSAPRGPTSRRRSPSASSTDARLGVGLAPPKLSGRHHCSGPRVFVRCGGNEPRTTQIAERDSALRPLRRAGAPAAARLLPDLPGVPAGSHAARPSAGSP